MKRINYAPGPYVSFCVDCDAEFMGHQLAVRCKQCAASCDTHPKDGDVKQAPLVSGAVGEAETPSPSSPQ